MNGNIYVSGRVMLDDGAPPAEPVTIERVCNGAPRAQAYTDKKGRFSFQIGQTSMVSQDASEQGFNMPGSQTMPTGIANAADRQSLANTSDLRLGNCDLRAVLAGYRSDIIALAGRRLMDDPSVGTIVLHRLGGVEGAAISVTSLQAPNAARKAYQRALQDLRKNKPLEARKELHKAVEIYPKYAAAWYELGQLQVQDREIAEARASFAKALAADAKFTGPYLPLIELAATSGNWTELQDLTERLTRLDPVDYPMAYFYNATACLNLGRLETALQMAREGERLDTEHRFPQLEQILSVILARQKDYTGAAEHMRNYLAMAPDADDGPRMRRRLAELDRLSGANQQAETVRPDGSRKEPR